jgi:hypothetical protein
LRRVAETLVRKCAGWYSEFSAFSITVLSLITSIFHVSDELAGLVSNFVLVHVALC